VIWLSALAQKAIFAAASITGKKFALMVGSSLIATTGIVAAGMTTSPSEFAPLAALLSRSLAANQEPAPIAVAEEPEEEEFETSSEESEPTSSGGESTSSESSPAAAPTEPEEASEEPEEKAPPPEEPEAQAGRVKHVFVVSLASPGYEASWVAATTQMPYLTTTLRPQGDLLSNYSLLDPASLPNSIATIGGQAPTAATKANCPDYGTCVYPAETLGLPDQLGIAQFTWRGYIEGMVNPETGQPDNCVYPQPGAPAETAVGGYTATLNPFVYFHSLLDLGDCSANDVPATGLEKDLKKVDSTPNYSYIAPTPCNSGIPGQCVPGTPEGPAAADAYLAQLVPKILASPAFKKDGLLIVTFGAANPVTAADPVTGAPAVPATSLKVGALLVSPFLVPGSTDGVAYNPYSLLKSSEDLFGLSYLEKAKGKKVRSFAPALLEEENGGD
jgi:hypothetical protein